MLTRTVHQQRIWVVFHKPLAMVSLYTSGRMWRSRGGSVILSKCNCMHGVSTYQRGTSTEQRQEGWDIGLLLDRNRIAEEQTLDI